MPIHDWSRVPDFVFHQLHHGWITHLSGQLNESVLPANYYASLVQTSEREPGHLSWREGQEVHTTVTLLYDIAVRHVSDDRVVAMIEIVSPGNKASQHPFERFLTKTTGWLASGYHVLVIDIQPRTARDPHGIHVALWAELGGASQQAGDTKPLTLASYRAGEPPQAFVEPTAVGDALKAMPLFLDGDAYVSAPLEESYLAALEGTPRRWRAELG
jgi:hypothetical protein